MFVKVAYASRQQRSSLVARTVVVSVVGCHPYTLGRDRHPDNAVAGPVAVLLVEQRTPQPRALVGRLKPGVPLCLSSGPGASGRSVGGGGSGK